MKRRVLVGAIAIASFSAATEGASTLTLAPSKDNTLFEDVNGTISNGAGPHLYVGLTVQGQLRRGAIAFDLSTVPANAAVSSVTLTLHHSRSGPISTVPIMLHRFLADWGEGSSFAPSPGGSGASAMPGDVTWKHAFYDDVLWATPGGVFAPTASATQNVTNAFGGAYQWSSPQLVADVQGWLSDPASNFGWALLGNETAFGSAERFDTKENTTVSQRPQLTILYDIVAAGSTWNVNGGGAWGTASNWTGGVPDGAGAEARFLDVLTAANAPATISLGGERTVGKLTFDNPSSYVIDGGNGERLTLDNGAGTATIDVRAGTHIVRTPLRIAGPTDASVDSRLEVTGGITIDGGTTFTKKGGGTLDVGGPAGVGVQMAPGARLDVTSGVLSTVNIRGGALKIDAGRINIKQNGTSAGASVLDSLEFEGLGTLDLSDNDLVVRGTAATKAAVLAEIVTRIKSARNAAAGRWEGPGITSSAAAANDLTGLAAVPNSGLASFSGIDVAADDVLVKYTYNGDANLDGRINADDYFRIDNGFLEQPQNPTYLDGDFNYDGLVNADDYFLIDSAFLGQSGPLTAAGLSAAVVPEPAAAGFVLAALFLCRRRRVVT